MAATIHTPYVLSSTQQEDEDIALANFIQTQPTWPQHPTYPQPFVYPTAIHQPQSVCYPSPNQVLARARAPNSTAQKSVHVNGSKAHRSSRKSSSHSYSSQPSPASSLSGAHPRVADRRPHSMMPDSRPANNVASPVSAVAAVTAAAAAAASASAATATRPIASAADQIRRSSITSETSTVSHAVSVSSMAPSVTKMTFSGRLRKVFSMSSLRNSRDIASLSGANSSNVSVNTSDTPSLHSNADDARPKKLQGLRRRSFASLSNLFHRSNISQTSIAEESTCPPENEKPISPTPTPAAFSSSVTSRRGSPNEGRRPSAPHQKKPGLRVDTEQVVVERKSILKSRSAGPDSPSSAISSRSPVNRLPTQQQPQSPQSQTPQRFAPPESLPSPSPSSSTSSCRAKSATNTVDDEAPASPNVGLHYALPLHESPKLKPASSATSSLADLKRRLQFNPSIQVHETFAASDYDRRCDPNATCQKLTPVVAMKIKQELNEYKLTDMEVHVESRQYTHFFL